MEAAMELFDKHWNQNPVRLLGITGTELVEKQQAYKQLDLFSFKEDAKDEPIFQMMNELNEKYGQNLIRKGAVIKKKKAKQGERALTETFSRMKRKGE